MAIYPAARRVISVTALKRVLTNQWKNPDLNTFISKSRPDLQSLLKYFRIDQQSSEEDVPTDSKSIGTNDVFGLY